MSIGIVLGMLASSRIAYCVSGNGLRTTYNEEDTLNSFGTHPSLIPMVSIMRVYDTPIEQTCHDPVSDDDQGRFILVESQ